MSEEPPMTILVAMGIAIGGAAVGSALDFWLGVLNADRFGGLLLMFLIIKLTLVALNVLFLWGMRRREQWAWRAASNLVVARVAFDCLSLVLPYLWLYDLEYPYLAWQLARSTGWLLRTPQFWILVHLLVIQAPILVLLRLKPSRRWVGIGQPTPDEISHW
jgi:hypothetical protein